MCKTVNLVQGWGQVTEAFSSTNRFYFVRYSLWRIAYGAANRKAITTVVNYNPQVEAGLSKLLAYPIIYLASVK